MYHIYVGESGNEKGHFVGTSEEIKTARSLATKERNKYEGNGWSHIVADDSSFTEFRGER